jgi:YbgC/YbaW family acyl-CoA thioester hydrolase
MPPHRYRVEVWSHQVDFLGHVNHAVYLHYMEQARMSWLRDNGWDLVRMNREGAPHTLVVAGMELAFKKPCYFGDRLLVETAVESMGRSSFRLRQDVLRAGEEKPVLEARVTAVFIDGRGKPISMTPELRELLATLHSP